MADGAQFVIDIATSLPDGATTIAELDELTASLTGAGRRGDDFQAAIKRISDQLLGVSAAAESAKAALAAGSAEYAVLEREALRASKAVERAAAKGGKGAVPPELVAQARAAHEALDAYTGTLEHLERESKRAGAEQDKLKRTLENVNKIAARVDDRNAKAIEKYGRLGQAVSQLPAPFAKLGGLVVRAGQANAGLSASFGSSAAQAILLGGAVLGVTVAVVAATAAAVAGFVAFAKYAVGLSDTGREAALTREAFAALSAETAAGVGAFDAIRDATGATDVQLIALTKQLRTAKVAAANMPEALRAAAMAEAALGQGGASEFVQRLQSGELAVHDFAAEVDAKFGGIVAKRLTGLAGLSARFERLWARLFDGLNIEPVLQALGILVGMFDRANPLAQALGDTIKGAFAPIAKYAVDAAYAIEAFALGFAIQLTKMYIAAKPALKWLSELFGFEADNDTFKAITEIGEVAAMVALVIGGGLVAAFAALGAVLALVLSPFVALIGWFYRGYQIVSTVIELLAKLYDVMVELGGNLLSGLAKGIAGAARALVDTVTGAVSSAIDAAKDVLGIHSPSKVFAEIGMNTVAGFTGAVDAGALDAQGSMAALVSPSDAGGTAASGAASAPAARGGASFDFAGASFTFNGVADAETARDRFAEMLTALLEGDADSLTGAVT